MLTNRARCESIVLRGRCISFLFHPKNYHKLSLHVTFSDTFDNLWKFEEPSGAVFFLVHVLFHEVNRECIRMFLHLIG